MTDPVPTPSEEDRTLGTPARARETRRRWLPSDPTILLTVGIAIGTLIGTVVTGVFNLMIEQKRFEGDLILQATSTPDRTEAKRNLHFFLDAGFLRDPERAISAALSADDFPSLSGIPETREQYGPTVAATRPAAYWRFVGNLEDAVGDHDASVAAGTEAYARGQATFNVNGTNWLQVPHAAALKPAAGTLMAWFTPASVHNGIVMAVNAPGTTNPADFALGVNDTGAVYCFFQQGGATQLIGTPAGYYSAGQDIQAAVIFDDSGFELWVDGNRTGRTNAGHKSGFTNNTLDWRFGEQHDRSAIFDGLIDDIAIWDRVLTAGEMLQIAQATLTD